MILAIGSYWLKRNPLFWSKSGPTPLRKWPEEIITNIYFTCFDKLMFTSGNRKDDHVMDRFVLTLTVVGTCDDIS